MSIKETVFSKRKRNFVEAFTLGGIIVPLIKMYDYKVFLYGGGRDTSIYLSFLERNGIMVQGIIDNDINKKGMEIDGVPYYVPYEMRDKISDPQNIFVIITTMYFAGLEQMKIMSTLQDMGITNFYNMDTYDKYELTGGMYGWANYFRTNIDELEKTYELFLISNLKS